MRLPVPTFRNLLWILLALPGWTLAPAAAADPYDRAAEAQQEDGSTEPAMDASVRTVGERPGENPLEGLPRGVPYLLEAWPEPEEGGIRPALDQDEAWKASPDARLPCSFIVRLARPPVRITAVAVIAHPEEPAREVSLLTYLGQLPLDADSFVHFARESFPHGRALMPQDGGVTLIELPEPADAHFLWVRLSRTWGEGRCALAGLRVYTEEDAEAIAASEAVWTARTVAARVDASELPEGPVMGFPNLRELGGGSEPSPQEEEESEIEDAPGSPP